VTVAADVDTAEAARFASDLDAPTLLDRDGALARAFGYRAIPNGFCFGPDGRLVGSRIRGFDIREADTRALVERWLAGSGAETVADAASANDPALDLFARGNARFVSGDREAALALWHRAYLLDPDNFVIRKQIWRALYPQRFGEPIDLAWQKEQTDRESRLGFTAANPELPPPA